MALAIPALTLGQTDYSSSWTAQSEVPDWVEPVEVPELAGDLDGSKWGDTRYIVVDSQTRTAPGYEQTFHHRATQAVTATGISAISTVEFEFDPTYSHLSIHGISIYRDGERIDALHPADLKVIQRESDLSRRIYDASLCSRTSA